MPIFILSILVQVAFVIHIVKTGRNTTWIWIVIMLPLAGSIAYFIIEILPGLIDSRTGRKARSGLGKIINPDKDIKQASYDYAVSDTVANSMRLAEECMQKEKFEEARDLYKKSLKGVHVSDPDVMYGLAKAEFSLANYSEVKVILDDLIAKNADYKNPHAHLLYARTLESLGEDDLAMQEYVVLNEYFSGPEASYYYAMLLQQKGNVYKANEIVDKIIQKSKISGRHYNSLYKKWINEAKNIANNR